MFKRWHLVVLESEDKVDSVVKMAAKHQLLCLHKIGVYGKERQHELYVVGKYIDWLNFKHELNSTEHATP